MAPTRKLFVYGKSFDAVAACEVVARSLPGYRCDLVDQLRRAAASIPLNIAEGAAEFSVREKIRFYRIARRSAAECEAILDVVERILDDPPRTEHARRRIEEALALLTNTARSLEKRA